MIARKQRRSLYHAFMKKKQSRVSAVKMASVICFRICEIGSMFGIIGQLFCTDAHIRDRRKRELRRSCSSPVILISIDFFGFVQALSEKIIGDIDFSPGIRKQFSVVGCFCSGYAILFLLCYWEFRIQPIRKREVTSSHADCFFFWI